MVYRFCRAIGFNGFTEFKLAAAAKFNHAAMPLEVRETQAKARTKVWAPVLSEVVRSIQLMHQRAAEGEVMRGVEWLHVATRVDFIGIGPAASLFSTVRTGFLVLGTAVSELSLEEAASRSMPQQSDGTVTILATYGYLEGDMRATVNRILRQRRQTIVLAASPLMDPLPNVATVDVGPPVFAGDRVHAAGLVGHLIALQVLLSCVGNRGTVT
jgi:DNA-binding MurR/RpiR family transcriptional regulator